jgi:G3E family GTPase
LVLTKTDLADEVTVADLLTQVRRINPDAPVVRSGETNLDAGALLSRVGTISEFHAPLMCDAPNGDSHGTHIRSFVVTVGEPIDWTAFGVWLTMLLNRHGDKVLRVKGILNLAGEAAPVAIHGVQHLVHNPVHLTGWPDEDRRSHIVFIVDGIDPDLVRRSLAAFNALVTPQAEWV